MPFPPETVSRLLLAALCQSMTHNALHDIGERSERDVLLFLSHRGEEIESTVAPDLLINTDDVLGTQ